MWYIHQTYTNCTCPSWHDLLMPLGGLCPWPTFHAWVTMVRKKWLSLYYSTYGCNIHQTYTNCPSWHYLLMSCGDLCPWPTFQASVTKTQNGNSGAPVIVSITIMSSLFWNWKLHVVFVSDASFPIWKCSLKSRLHYQSFLVQENLVKVFDANFDSVNGQRKLWSKSIKELGRTLME